MDAQLTSPLLNLPLEIRRAIYTNLLPRAGFHIAATATQPEASHFQLSPCLDPDLYSQETGIERQVKRPTSYRDVVWICRLSSAWGPHWRCEEGQSDWDGCEVLMSVCKQMHLELGEFLIGTAEFHVAGLQTLNDFIEALTSSSKVPSAVNVWGRSRLVSPYMSRLSITLSLPFSFFDALEANDTNDSDPSLANDLRIWSALPATFASLPRLRHVHIWIDHTDRRFWSSVNERALLGQFTTLLDDSPDLNLVIILPKTHPKLEDPKLHYTPDQVPTSHGFVLHRVLRQRYRISQDPAGDPVVSYAKDFPHCENYPFFDHLSLEEKERHEEELWRAGVDADKVLPRRRAISDV